MKKKKEERVTGYYAIYNKTKGSITEVFDSRRKREPRADEEKIEIGKNFFDYGHLKLENGKVVMAPEKKQRVRDKFYTKQSFLEHVASLETDASKIEFLTEVLSELAHNVPVRR